MENNPHKRDENRLVEIAQECAARNGAHLIELLRKGGRHNKPVIEVFVDTEAGVTTELCAEISRDIGRSVEERGAIVGPYDLVVSSPGTDRPLKFPWQFKKHIGRLIGISVREDHGVIEYTGKLISVMDEEKLVISLEGGPEVAIAFEAMQTAVVKVPW